MINNLQKFQTVVTAYIISNLHYPSNTIFELNIGCSSYYLIDISKAVIIVNLIVPLITKAGNEQSASCMESWTDWCSWTNPRTLKIFLVHIVYIISWNSEEINWIHEENYSFLLSKFCLALIILTAIIVIIR